MSHRHDQRAQARAEREAAERRDAALAQRKRRLVRLGAVATAAVVVVVVAIVAAGGGGGGSATSAKVTGAADSRAMLRGVPQAGTRLGDPQAPLVLTEFADLQCPYCRQYSVDVLPHVIQDYVRTGKLQLELRLLRFVGPDSDRAARAAYAAAQKNRMWNFVDLFYRNQGTENSGYANDGFLRSVGSAAGASGVLSALTAPAHEQAITANEARAQALGISSTPTFLIGSKPGAGRTLSVAQLTPEAFQAAIEKQLKG